SLGQSPRSTGRIAVPPIDTRSGSLHLEESLVRRVITVRHAELIQAHLDSLAFPAAGLRRLAQDREVLFRRLHHVLESLAPLRQVDALNLFRDVLDALIRE